MSIALGSAMSSAACGRAGVVIVALGLAVGLSLGACGDDVHRPAAPVEAGPVTGFFLIEPSSDQDFTLVDGTAASGLVAVGQAGRWPKVQDLFRWSATGDQAGKITWLHAPDVEPGEPLGVLGFTTSSDGGTILGSVFHRETPTAFFVWRAEEQAAKELTRAIPGAPITLLAGVADRGEALYGSDTSHSFRWTPAGDIQWLPPAAGHAGLQVTDISGDGRVLSGQSLIDARSSTIDDDVTGLFRWTATGGTEALPLPADIASCRRGGGRMSHDGNVVFGTCINNASPSQQEIVRWSAETGTDVLRIFPVYSDVRVHAVSGDGTEAMASAYILAPTPPGTTKPSPHVLLWKAASGWQDLPLPEGAIGCGPLDKHTPWRSSGTIIGVCDLPGGEIGAKWNAAGDVTPLLPPEGFPESSTSSASDDGTTVAGFGRRPLSSTDEETIAVIWKDDRRDAQPVDAFLRRTFALADLGATTLTADVSADGKTLWGTATDAQGRKVAWIARLP